MPVTLVDIGLGFLGIYLVRELYNRTSHPLPPGPKPYPIIGNLLDIPTGRAWLQYAAFKQKYGPIICLNVFGMHIIALNDLQVAFDLFEKRSNIYSDRPRIVFGGEMCGWEDTLALLRSGERHRLFRKHLHHVIGTRSALERFHPMIEIEMRRLLYRVLQHPSRLLQNIQTSAVAIILKMTHGYSIDPLGPDPLVSLAEEGVSQISMAAQPGAFLVDALPFLRYVPEWVPGTGFKQTARFFKATVTELVEKPFAFVKHQMSKGVASPSYTQEHLEKSDGSVENEHIIKWSASSLYTAGADTTVGTIQTFFLAMLLHPEVVKTAQTELDAVIGPDRLPTFMDRERLPYINAIVKETLRWHPVAPMGLPHVPVEDDLYEGYMIPKGSIIMPNVYGFTRDPSLYAQADKFIPERFIGGDAYGGKDAEMDVASYTFGFGRRVCPGNNLADASLFIATAMSLAAFDFNLAKDDKGQPIVPEFEFTPGTLSHPKPFKSACVPRSAKVAALIRTVQEEHPWGSTDPETLSSLDWKASVGVTSV